MLRLQRFKSGPHGRLARRPTEGRNAQLQPRGRFRKGRCIVAMNDGLNERDLRMVNEQREGVADHRGAPHLAILLGSGATRTDATAGRHHDGRYPSRHRIHRSFSMCRRAVGWAKSPVAADDIARRPRATLPTQSCGEIEPRGQRRMTAGADKSARRDAPLPTLPVRSIQCSLLNPVRTGIHLMHCILHRSTCVAAF